MLKELLKSIALAVFIFPFLVIDMKIHAKEWDEFFDETEKLRV